MALTLETPSSCCLRRHHAILPTRMSNRSKTSSLYGMANRRKLHLQQHLRATKQGELVLSDVENTLLETFQTEITGGSGADATTSCHSLLLEAVTKRNVQPDRVLGAMLFLEEQNQKMPITEGPSKIQFLSYIPVDEDFVIDSSDSSLKLESDLGPLRAKFGGAFKWRGTNELDFSFTQAEVDLFGRSVWRKDVAFKPKTYSYFWLRDDVACARSSGGTLTLMRRLPSAR